MGGYGMKLPLVSLHRHLGCKSFIEDHLQMIFLHLRGQPKNDRRECDKYCNDNQVCDEMRKDAVEDVGNRTFRIPRDDKTMRQKIETVKNLEGKKIRALGSAVDLALRQLNATPIRMSAPEIYESLSRGTLDGTVISYVAAMCYDLGPLAKSVTTGQGFGSAVLTYSISETRWKGLPPNVQQAMLKAGDEATRRSCEWMDKDTETDLARLQKLGIAAVTFSPGEQQELATLFTKVGTAWGEELDRRGKSGSEVLKAYQEAVRNVRRGQP
jgi:TRAP-type C4-dicarboxylate transport system substrate-binding protein